MRHRLLLELQLSDHFFFKFKYVLFCFEMVLCFKLHLFNGVKKKNASNS